MQRENFSMTVVVKIIGKFNQLIKKMLVTI